MEVEIEIGENQLLPDIPRWCAGSEYSYTLEHGVWLRSQDRLLIPDFQRELVWTLDQKIRFMESVILNLPIGVYTLHENPGFTYGLLDGQQRWDAIFGFLDDKFEVFGYRWSALTEIDRRRLHNTVFACRAIKGFSRDQQKEIYDRLAYGGTPHEPPTPVPGSGEEGE